MENSYLTNEKWITGLKSHKFIEVEKNIEYTSREFAAFQIIQCDITFILQPRAFKLLITVR